MPGEALPDRFQHRAHLRPVDTFLDRLAAADAERNSADRHGSRRSSPRQNTDCAFSVVPAIEILHQHLVGKGIRCDKFMHGVIELMRVAHEPDAAAGGADRGLDHGGKAHRRTSSLSDVTIAVAGCGNPNSLKQSAEAGLAVRGAIAVERRRRERDLPRKPLLHAREQKSLLMGRQQHVETPRDVSRPSTNAR